MKMPNKYALMTFDTEINLGLSNKPNKWINYETKFYDNGINAFYEYLHSVGETQLIIGESDEERDKLIVEMKNNYANEEWLNNNVYNIAE